MSFNIKISLILLFLTLFQLSRSAYWSAWTISGCTDTCGNCGFVVRNRTCLSGNGSGECRGKSSQTTETRCPDEVCKFPRGTCCLGRRMADAKHRRLICRLDDEL